MSMPPDIVERLQELVLLPPDDPQRMLFVASLASADEATRLCWQSLLREEQMLRSGLSQAEMPSALLQQLKNIPISHARKLPGKRNIPWPLAAAAVLAVAGIGGYLIWDVYHPPRPKVVQLHNLPADAENRIITLTLADYTTPPALDIASSNPATVINALQTKIGSAMPFPVSLPGTPRDFELQGGSVVSLGKGQAVYTSWTHQGHRYALFQFAPENFAIPHEFAQDQPQQCENQSLALYRVDVWPGNPNGTCTWVAIGERNAPAQPFSSGEYRFH